jgi:hypothetical protein
MINVKVLILAPLLQASQSTPHRVWSARPVDRLQWLLVLVDRRSFDVGRSPPSLALSVSSPQSWAVVDGTPSVFIAMRQSPTSPGDI